MEIARGLSSEPTGFVFAMCSRAKRIKCIGVKTYVQRYREHGGLTVALANGRTEHYFGNDIKPIFGFNEVM